MFGFPLYINRAVEGVVLVDAIMSSSTEAKKNAGSLSSTECPVCNQLVVSDLINQHLDRCLKTGTSQKNSKSPKDSPRKSPSRKKKTGTVSATSISPPNTPKGSSTSKVWVGPGRSYTFLRDSSSIYFLRGLYNPKNTSRPKDCNLSYA